MDQEHFREQIKTCVSDILMGLLCRYYVQINHNMDFQKLHNILLQQLHPFDHLQQFKMKTPTDVLFFFSGLISKYKDQISNLIQKQSFDAQQHRIIGLQQQIQDMQESIDKLQSQFQTQLEQQPIPLRQQIQQIPQIQQQQPLQPIQPIQQQLEMGNYDINNNEQQQPLRVPRQPPQQQFPMQVQQPQFVQQQVPQIVQQQQQVPQIVQQQQQQGQGRQIQQRGQMKDVQFDFSTMPGIQQIQN